MAAFRLRLPFERQNPGAKVLHLYAIWLRGERHELVEVERIPDGVVVSLDGARGER